MRAGRQTQIVESMHRKSTICQGLLASGPDHLGGHPFRARERASQKDELTTAAPTAEALAQQFKEMNAALIDTAANCSAEQWRRPIAGEPRPVGVIAHHVSEVEGFFAGVLSGSIPDLALSSADIDANNARHAEEHANADQAETVAALRANGEALAQAIASLSAEDLQASPFSIDGQELTKEQVIQFGVIGHFEEHLASIRAVIGE